MTPAERLLRELGERWTHPARPTLRVLGSTALMLRTDYERGTKDSDVLETLELDSTVKAALLDLAGEGSRLAIKWRLYVQVVPNGLPFLPISPRRHPVIAASETSLAIEALDVVDVVVSKLKRFHANDRADIEAMIDRDLVPHAELLARFRSAVDAFSGDARAEDLPRYVRNLHTIERDSYDVPESEIDLPEWI